nr:hypothetical protein [Mycobacterium leprae]
MLYGALAHLMMESTGLVSCVSEMASMPDVASPLSAPANRLTGPVCLGPLQDRSAVCGVFSYLPRARIPNTGIAYPAAFLVGLLPTNPNDTGLVVKTASLSNWRTDGAPVTEVHLGDSGALTGDG